MQDAKTAPAETKEKNSSHLRCGAVRTPRFVGTAPGRNVIVYRPSGGWPRPCPASLVEAEWHKRAGHWDPKRCLVVGADDLGTVTVSQ